METHATFAARYGVAQKATQEVLGHSDANLTANIYTEMPAEAIRAELTKLPWISDDPPKKSAPNCAPFSGRTGQIVSDADKSETDVESRKYFNSPLKRRISAALVTLGQELGSSSGSGDMGLKNSHQVPDDDKTNAAWIPHDPGGAQPSRGAILP
jgi:hypothetical protein